MNDSVWAIVSGMVKAFNLTPDYVLNNMSYANVIMYGAVLPSYGGDKKKGGRNGSDGNQKVIRADDPANREEVKRFFESCD